MKLAALGFGIILLVALGGFAYLAVTDVPVEQTQVAKTIPNDRFFDAN